MEKFKKVSKEEFKKFIEEYPNELKTDIARICEPPLLSYNDFTIADKWPDSIVAKVILLSYMDEDMEDEYKILKE